MENYVVEYKMTYDGFEFMTVFSFDDTPTTQDIINACKKHKGVEPIRWMKIQVIPIEK